MTTQMRSEYAPFDRSPLTVHVCGTPIEIPFRPAAAWAVALDHPGWLAALLADEAGREVIADLLIEQPRAREDVRAESLRILSEACGRKWWEAARLIVTSASPEVLGRMVLAGVDPWSRSIGEWCAAAYTVCTKGHDEKGRLKFDFRLSIPPRGYEDEWDDDGDDPEVTMKAVRAISGS